jgi:hypothetical protein
MKKRCTDARFVLSLEKERPKLGYYSGKEIEIKSNQIMMYYLKLRNKRCKNMRRKVIVRVRTFQITCTRKKEHSASHKLPLRKK